ncbi:2731_t:CDS:10 [Cetraspora pellucida]|uniref:2731_t:CDS:1 n=1 Tax=Cetraspora pellucida TaxID=1433469 RepID=A0A9N9EYK2_9GLOM|nr:2731_t:CDS:10 [Cetraspora pellucida]
MTIHEYFTRAYTEWNIINFLNQCNEEPFRLKVDLYLRSLENIINCEKGKRKEKAQFLLDKYKSSISRATSQRWDTGDQLACLMFQVYKPSQRWTHRHRQPTSLADFFHCQGTQPDYKLARKWNDERANKQIHFHQPTFTSGGTNNINISGITNGGTFVTKRDHEENKEDQDQKHVKRTKLALQLRGYIPLSRSSSDVVTPPPLPSRLGGNAPIGYFGIHAFPPYDSLQVQSSSLEDDSDLSVNENPSVEVQHLISKMENVKYRLFEYSIVNLSEKNLVDPVNNVFSDDDKKRMRKFWEDMEPSTEEKLNTVRKSKWEKSIKPLVDKYASAIEIKSAFDDEIQTLSSEVIFEKPFEGKFDFRTQYDLLWVQDIYRRFVLLFASCFNILRDATMSEIAYRESFVNPIIPKAFDDMKDKIGFQTGEIESTLRKEHRNQTNDQKPRILLGSNYDGILKFYVNANEIEIGFLEVVGNATIVDLKKYREDKEKLLKAMQLSIFYQRQHHLRRNAPEEQLKCLQSFERETTIYTMHRVKGGLHVVDILSNFTIPDSKSQLYVLDEIVRKAYFFKVGIQEISKKAQQYTPSNENPLEASPSKSTSMR